MNFKYKWKNDKARYLWQDRTYNIFRRQGWDPEDLELFYSISESIIEKEVFTATFKDESHATGIIDKVDELSFKNQALFLQHEVDEYLEVVHE